MDDQSTNGTGDAPARMAPARIVPAVRKAGPADAEELVRLRAIMLESLNPGLGDDSWQPVSTAVLREALAAPMGDMMAFVVDVLDAADNKGSTGSPERSRRSGLLAACAVGTVEHRLGSPGNEAGLTGHVFSVATDPAMRRRGYSRACLEGLLEWYRERGVPRIDLHASEEGAPLYTSLGFVPTRASAMRLLL